MAKQSEVERILSKIQSGDWITVYWIDASESKDVPPHINPIPNHYVETRQVSEGRFLYVQKGGTWHISHIIISHGSTDDKLHIESIPIPIVMKVEVGRKVALKSPTVRRRTVIRFSDGGVKNLK